MLINAPQCMSPIVRLGAFLVFLLMCAILILPRRFAAPPTFAQVPGNSFRNVTETSSIFNASIIDFWQDVASALVATAPQCKPLRVQDEHVHHAEHHFDPLNPGEKISQQLLNFTDQDETALLRAHYKMRKSTLRLAPKLPFSAGTTGIVTATDSEQLPVFLVSLRMLRRTGCSLPMEVFVDDWTVRDRTTCDIILPSLNARCISLSEGYTQSLNITSQYRSQDNILAIMLSTFQDVLYLDADAFPVYDPTVLFTTPPYTTHGLVTWPSFFGITTSPHYYHIAGVPVEPVSTRYSTDSSQIMLNKNMHQESLLMMVYYNYYGPDYYYPLSSRHQETFIQAALATGLPWYQVRTAPKALGRLWNGTFRATGLAQADCGTDFEYGAPYPSHIHESAKWEKEDRAHPDLVVEEKLNYTRHTPPSPKPVFVHQNMLQMDPSKLLLDTNEITYEAHDGTMHRMWGFKEDMERTLGFDVERRLWDVVEEEACRELESTDKCKRVRDYVREVFGWMESIDRPW
ncbi:hypothetical protein HBI24_217740 [Parastagonospora nodorum]|nr:hypothetical protein HBI24_217740 [Parastagonospora nodorum]